MLAAQFPLKLGDRVSTRIGTQARQPLGVARTGILRRDRLRLRLLRRRHLGSAIDRRSGWPRLDHDAFEQALYLGFQPLAGKLALKAGNRIPRRVRAQARQTLFVAVAGERRIGGGLRRWRLGRWRRGRWRQRFGRLNLGKRLGRRCGITDDIGWRRGGRRARPDRRGRLQFGYRHRRYRRQARSFSQPAPAPAEWSRRPASRR